MKPRPSSCRHFSAKLWIALVCVGCANGETDPTQWAWAEVPNPRVLLFSKAADPHGNGEVYVLTREGVISQVLDNTHANYNPSITADGKRVAFHRWMTPGDFNSLELFMVDVETGEETRLTND